MTLRKTRDTGVGGSVCAGLTSPLWSAQCHVAKAGELNSVQHGTRPSAWARQAQAPPSLSPGHMPARPEALTTQAPAQRDSTGGATSPPTSGLRVAPTGMGTSQAGGVDICLPRPAAHVGLAQTALGPEPARVFSGGLATTVHRLLPGATLPGDGSGFIQGQGVAALSGHPEATAPPRRPVLLDPHSVGCLCLVTRDAAAPAV